VSGVIEPLKALVYRALPDKVPHANAFLRIIEKRGRMDPTELVLRVRKLRVLRQLGRALILLMRGKINPLRTALGLPINRIEYVRRLFRSFRSRP
jgi:hypothetical protein